MYNNIPNMHNSMHSVHSSVPNNISFHHDYKQPGMFDYNQFYIIFATTITGLITTSILTSISMIKDGIYKIVMVLIDWYNNKNAPLLPSQYSYKFEFRYSLQNISVNQQLYQNIVNYADMEKVNRHVYGRFDEDLMKMIFIPESSFIVDNVIVYSRASQVIEEPKNARPNGGASPSYAVGTPSLQTQPSSMDINFNVELRADNPKYINALLTKVSKSIIQNVKGKQSIWFAKKYGDSYNGGTSAVKYTKMDYDSKITLDDLVLEEDLVDKIKHGVSLAMKGKNKYALLLHGMPGCGKTRTISAIIGHTGWDATFISLADLTNAAFSDIFFSNWRNNGNELKKHTTANNM
jgi:hypothetical protein